MPVDKYTMLDLIVACHKCGYIKLRNDLIEDVKHSLTDEELKLVMELVHSGVLPNI